jgi:glycosyltransferase involved in cell wall biosynthesis
MSSLPKVSGLLAVGYEDKYFRVAADAFLSSTYEGELELVILDNNAVPLDPSLIPDDPRVKYYRCDRMPIGSLRNLATSYATGDICVSLDEDDWSHPERVGQQVGRLLGTGKAVTGFHSIYYFNESDRQTYKYWYEPQGRNHPPYACGSSQCYLKSWWEQHKYPETGVEDYPFQLAALHANQLDSVDGAELLVARAHAGSLSFPTQLGKHRQFPAVHKDELPKEFYLAIAPKVEAPKAAAKPKKQKTQETN